MTIQTVGIIGAGQMGNGITHVFATSGFEVLLNDISADGINSDSCSTHSLWAGFAT